MKKILCLILITIFILVTVSCNSESSNSGKVTQPIQKPQATQSTQKSQTTQSTQKPKNTNSAHVHSFVPATCKLPKTCSCGVTEGKPLDAHDTVDGKCSMCNISYYEELRELLFKHGTYDKKNIAVNGTLMKESYTYVVQKGYAKYEMIISKYEDESEWSDEITLYITSSSIVDSEESFVLWIDKASVKKQTYSWRYNGAGTSEVSGSVYAPDFSSTVILKYTSATCSSSLAGKYVESASGRLSLAVKGIFKELLGKSENNITLTNFGFENYE